ncbi:hypothetical protein K466DRAFT_294513 [Polyporus arcularius HHB13444]|uniref:Uncharacterized protein n=1 Tax=Polyporus arcularius HHB13444 TaxID=1314778 RepID=A0A5C3P2X8_9APHY|nr:hypothetical protein K466DRAFT_294513 [Polyporus arcularius HHB13444]
MQLHGVRNSPWLARRWILHPVRQVPHIRVPSPLPCAPTVEDLEYTRAKSRDADLALARSFYGLIFDGNHSYPNVSSTLISMTICGMCQWPFVAGLKTQASPHTPRAPFWSQMRRRSSTRTSRTAYTGRGMGSGSTTPATRTGTLCRHARQMRVSLPGRSLSEAIHCATYSPSRCLGSSTGRGIMYAAFVVD